VTFLDLLTWALTMALPRVSRPDALGRRAYPAVMSLSAVTAPAPLFACFFVWKLLRMYLLLGVPVRACARDPLVPPALLRGMTWGHAL